MTGLAAIAAATGTARAPDYAPVTDARLAAANTDDGWLMYRHDYGSIGYSALPRRPRT